jgi:hypothetical protein
MPKRVVGILVISVLMGLSAAVNAAEPSHDNGKSATPTTQPAPQPQQTGAAPPKLLPVSRDVCAKHPNLKQCS